jgi:hypothetical protein
MASNKQQTAVEFLKEALSIHFSFDEKMRFEGLFQQAKEMEKEQIVDSYIEGGRKGFNFFGDDYEKYYKENFNQ